VGLVCIIAMLAGIWMTSAFLLPAFNALWPYMKLQTDYFGPNSILPAMAVVLGGMVIIAGAYPALYISKFEPVKILKGTFTFEGMTGFSLVLLALQFIISLVGIISSVAFIQNAQYQAGINLGFEQSLIFSHVRDGKEAELFMTEIRKNPDVIAAASSRHIIGWSVPRTMVQSGTSKIETDVIEVGDHYLQTAGMTILSGRDFVQDSKTDKKESVIVSEAFVQSMGWSEAIGKKIVLLDTVSLYVVGVVKDIYSRGLWRKVEPTMLRYAEKDICTYVTVSASEENISRINARIEEQWKKLFPNRLYDGRYANAMVVEAIQVNENILKMFGFTGFIAMLLSGTGLFTLVSLNILKRYKEIGIRKVLGANELTIAGLINKKFLMVLVVASIVGSWLSIMAVEGIMRGIWAVYQRPGMMSIMAGVALLLTISFVTIGSRVYQAVRMNPVDSLRTE